MTHANFILSKIRDAVHFCKNRRLSSSSPSSRRSRVGHPSAWPPHTPHCAGMSHPQQKNADPIAARLILFRKNPPYALLHLLSAGLFSRPSHCTPIHPKPPSSQGAGAVRARSTNARICSIRPITARPVPVTIYPLLRLYGWMHPAFCRVCSMANTVAGLLPY